MENKILAGISVILFTYMLISWALGRALNKKKEPKRNEFQNFLTGAWIIGLFIIFGIAISYLS